MYFKPEDVLTVDIETTGLDPWRDEITLVGTLWKGVYSYFRNKEEFREYILEQHGTAAWLGHNITFDIKFLLVKGWIDKVPKVIHDTQIMAHVMKEKVPKSYLDRYEIERKERNKSLTKGFSHRYAQALSLKVLAPWFLKVDWFWETPEDHDNIGYNQKDCSYTDKLFDKFWDKMDQTSLEFYHKRMLPWAQMLLEMTLTGISLDEAQISAAENEYLEKCSKAKAELDEMWAGAHIAYWEIQRLEVSQRYKEMLDKALLKAKDPTKSGIRYGTLCAAALEKVETKINFNSPDQMKWLLKDYLGLDITKIEEPEEDEDPESTGKAVLNKLIGQGRKDIEKFLEWRKASKISTAFFPTYRELAVDNVIHPSFKITGTRTGRTSCSDPNMQQVPPDLYRIFKPRSGMTFLQYDLSGIEAALIALYSNDLTLYEVLDTDRSIHDFHAKELFGLDCEVEEVKDKYPLHRKAIKNVGFACFYGAGWRRIQVTLGSGGFPQTEREARQKLQILKSLYPGVFGFHKDITSTFEDGGVIENLLGRPISIQDPADAYMKGFNTLIQSSASDLNLHACYKAKSEWAKSGIKGHPLLVIHDCIIAEIEKSRAEVASKVLVSSMTDYDLTCDHGPIKLKVEGGISDVWKK